MKVGTVFNEEKSSSFDHFILVQEKSPKHNEFQEACRSPTNTGQARIAFTRHTGIPIDFFLT